MNYITKKLKDRLMTTFNLVKNRVFPFAKVKRKDQSPAISHVDVTERLKTRQPQPIPHHHF